MLDKSKIHESFLDLATDLDKLQIESNKIIESYTSEISSFLRSLTRSISKLYMKSSKLIGRPKFWEFSHLLILIDRSTLNNSLISSGVNVEVSE